MTIQEMKERKKELGYTNQVIACLSGVPVSTVNKIFGGTTSSPKRSTILAIESVLAYRTTSMNMSDSGSESDGSYIEDSPAGCIASELLPAYITGTETLKKVQGEYTIDDYFALPDDIRVELIDGVFYNMSAPFVSHQFIATQIGHQLMGFVEKNNGSCKPVLSPVDVQLDKDNRTIVQPDVLIICDPEILIKNGRVFGAPDFVIEILSESTRRKDIYLKTYKYGRAGVREYWIVDPKRLTVTVYDIEHDETPMHYTFEDKIPVLIWNSTFSVDFHAVYEYIKDYL